MAERGRPKATPTIAQQAALNAVRVGKAEYRKERESVEKTVRARVQAEMAESTMAYAMKIREALDLGCTKAAIGEAMGTSDRGTIGRWLDKTAKIARTVIGVAQVFTLNDDETVSVSFPSFPSKYSGDAGYPNVLVGVARRIETGSGWEAAHDPETQETTFGPLPGFFTMELTGDPYNPASLPAQLNEWLAQHGR